MGFPHPALKLISGGESSLIDIDKSDIKETKTNENL